MISPAKHSCIIGTSIRSRGRKCDICSGGGGSGGSGNKMSISICISIDVTIVILIVLIHTTNTAKYCMIYNNTTGMICDMI